MIIKEGDGFKWRLTGIYGEPKTELRENTWKLLRTLHGHVNLPWLCVGDFNEILYTHEKQDGNFRPQRYMDNFRNVLNFCNRFFFLTCIFSFFLSFRRKQTQDLNR